MSGCPLSVACAASRCPPGRLWLDGGERCTRSPLAEEGAVYWAAL